MDEYLALAPRTRWLLEQVATGRSPAAIAELPDADADAATIAGELDALPAELGVPDLESAVQLAAARSALRLVEADEQIEAPLATLKPADRQILFGIVEGGSLKRVQAVLGADPMRTARIRQRGAHRERFNDNEVTALRHILAGHSSDFCETHCKIPHASTAAWRLSAMAKAGVETYSGVIGAGVRNGQLRPRQDERDVIQLARETRFTDRELDAVRALSRGASRADAAAALGLSEWQLGEALNRICAKLDIVVESTPMREHRAVAVVLWAGEPRAPELAPYVIDEPSLRALYLAACGYSRDATAAVTGITVGKVQGRLKRAFDALDTTLLVVAVGRLAGSGLFPPPDALLPAIDALRDDAPRNATLKAVGELIVTGTASSEGALAALDPLAREVGLPTARHVIVGVIAWAFQERLRELGFAYALDVGKRRLLALEGPERPDWMAQELYGTARSPVPPTPPAAPKPPEPLAALRERLARTDIAPDGEYLFPADLEATFVVNAGAVYDAFETGDLPVPRAVAGFLEGRERPDDDVILALINVTIGERPGMDLDEALASLRVRLPVSAAMLALWAGWIVYGDDPAE